VLLMVFAALLGSTFITVVALNLSQTARSENRNEAAVAAQAALKYVNDQITTGVEGEAWRPEKLSPPPAPIYDGTDTTPDATYNFYYTPFERAQGWTLPSDFAYKQLTATPLTAEQKWGQIRDWKKIVGNENKPFFIKFPDPRKIGSISNPSYIVEVTPVLTGDKAGMLRITAIGRSTESDAAFARLTAYKTTAANGSPLSFARFDANYDYLNNKPLSARATVTDAALFRAGDSILVDNATGLEPGQTVVIKSGTSTAFRILTKVGKLNATDAFPRVISWKTALPGSFTPTPLAEIRAASVLADGLTTIDADGYGVSGTAAVIGAPPAAPSTTGTPSRNAVGTHGIWINNGALVVEKLDVTLDPDSQKGLLNVAGPIDVTGATGANVRVSGTPSAITAVNPRVKSDTGANPQSIVKPMSPLALYSRFQRYLEITQNADIPNGSGLGYGPGVYISNADDVEKVYDAVTTRYRNLKDFELRRLWQRKPLTNMASGAAAHFLSFPPASTPTQWTYPNTYPSSTDPRSLEERGIRGWINPWEYLPRGASVELRGNEIIITRDDRSDAKNNTELFVTKPDPGKGWKLPTGAAPASGANNYRMRIVILPLDAGTGISQGHERWIGAPGAETKILDTPIPFNGVIMAEGNIRVRGFLGLRSAGIPDVTIVSKANIYVEGSIIRNPADIVNPSDTGLNRASRIALIAKRNVVLNPTQFVAHPAGWQNPDVVVAAFGGGGRPITIAESTITVTDGTFYRVGDSFRLISEKQVQTVAASTAEKVTRTITAITGNVLTFAPSYATGAAPTPAADYIVALTTDPVIGYGESTTFTNTSPLNYQTREVFARLGLDTHTRSFHRVAKFDGDPTLTTASSPLYLSMLHGGEMKRALTLSRTQGGTANVQVKEDADTNGNIESTEKTLSFDPNPTQSFNLLDADENGTEDGDFTETLEKLRTGPSSTRFPIIVTGPPARRWEISYTLPIPEEGNIAARRLAASKEYSVPTLLPPSNDAHFTLTTSSLLSWRQVEKNLIGTPQANAPTADENLLGTYETFYWIPPPALSSDWKQAPLRVASRQLTNGTVTPVLATDNDISLNIDAPYLAPYRFGGMAVSRVNYEPLLDAAVMAPTSVDMVELRVQATMIAQEGSVFVLPTPPRTSLDASLTDDRRGDLNGDRATNGLDTAAATWYRRANYKITVRGNIIQNVTPAMEDYDSDTSSQFDSDGRTATGVVAFGPLKASLDSSSFPAGFAKNNTNFGGAVGVVSWNSVVYEPDVIPVDTDLKLPPSPDLLYVG
jgi:hypothetical protein